MTTKTMDSEGVRLPKVQPGQVLVVTRYSSPRAVVVHPEDYEQLCRAKELMSRLGKLDPRQLSSVEASVIRSSQDEEFDLDLIRDEDLVR